MQKIIKIITTKMIIHYANFIVLCLISTFGLSSAQDEVNKPTFPEVFETEIQGVFQNELSEVDASMYYDRENNRAALFFTYQNTFTRSIYNFEKDQLIYIDGYDCTVTEIESSSGGSFFPFNVDKNGKKIMAKAEEVLFFTNSKLDRQDISVFPAYVYATTADIPQYGRKNCDIIHVFSKPEVEIPTCEGHACQPTLIAISVKCKNTTGYVEVDHTYNFYRFRSDISDKSVFQTPVGVHCDVGGTESIPNFPSYFSFSFDVTEKQSDSETDSVFTTHKKVWYDGEFQISRVDEFDDYGLLTSSRIFDLMQGAAYTIIATVPTCDMGPIQGRINFDQVTRLPRFFFLHNATIADKAVYVGKRNVHGLEYDTWTLTWEDKESGAMIVEEIYFLKTAPNTVLTPDIKDEEDYLQVTHADIYTYETDADTGLHTISLLTYLAINNFRSKPKEWEAFDIASCFSSNEKIDFKLNITGPPIVKGSHCHSEILELLYRKLLSATKVSVLRISELRGVFDGVHLSEVHGSILDNSVTSSWLKTSEPDMKEAYHLIKEAAKAGNLSVTLPRNISAEYNVTAIEEDIEISKEPSKGCISGEILAAVTFTVLFVGITFGITGYYVFLKRRAPVSLEKVQLHNILT